MTRPSDAEAQQLLVDIVSVASVSHQERPVAELLRTRMQGMGFQSRIDGAGNVHGEIGTGPLTIALVGHIDTVPGDLPVRVEDGILHGRGSVDAKGPFACFVIAAARAALACPQLRLRVIGCVEEEVASSAGARFLVDQPAPDALVIGEPSGWDGITLGYKGYLRATLEVQGDNTHTAHDVATVPAQAARLWNRLEAAAEHYDAGRKRAFERLLPALLDMRCTGDGRRQSASLDLSLRLPPDLPPEAAQVWLEELAPEAQVSIQGAVPAWSGPRTSFLHRALARGIRAEGGRAVWKEKTGTADLNILAPAWGCPALAYGPGDAALDHRPDEHIILDEFQAGVRVLEAALVSCAASEAGLSNPV